MDPRNLPAPEIIPSEEEIAEMKTKLESLGEVNLAAITESRLTEERLTFLLEQEDDLNKAVDSLYATINTINKTTTERFRAAFDSVNEQFQEIFPFLFRGGEGRLELTNEDDLLESGVEIMARPPGQKDSKYGPPVRRRKSLDGRSAHFLYIPYPPFPILSFGRG